MESNRDWLKNYVQPLLISESVYRKKPELISQISINNFDGFKDVNLDTLLETMDVWMSNNTISYVNGWFPVYEYLETIKEEIITGIVKEFKLDHVAQASDVFAVMAKIGGEKLVGSANNLDPNTFWKAYID